MRRRRVAGLELPQLGLMSLFLSSFGFQELLLLHSRKQKLLTLGLSLFAEICKTFSFFYLFLTPKSRVQNLLLGCIQR